MCLSTHRRADAINGAVAVEQVVGVERNDLAGRRDEMDAGALDATDTEIEAVHELDDRDAEHVLVADAGGKWHLRQAAQELGHALASVLRSGGEREQLHELAQQNRLLLE